MLFSPKAKKLILIYSTAALVTLSVLSAVLYERLSFYRLAAAYSSGQSLDTAVAAVNDMSEELSKSLYATDGSMCAKLCCEIYADSLAAEAAVSSLPFDTYELEQIAGFINTAGDYAYSLCCSASEDGFTDQQRRELSEMSDTSAGLAQKLLELQAGVNNGVTLMDTVEVELPNIGVGTDPTVGDTLRELESGFPKAAALRYDGQYTASDDAKDGTLTEAEILSIAAKAAGAEERALKEEYSYEGSGSRRCYSYGDLTICVSADGLRSMGQSRLVSDVSIDEETARAAAEDFLSRLGFSELTLSHRETAGAVMRYEYVPVMDGAMCIDNCVTISVAMDDGGIFAFNAENYDSEKPELRWNFSDGELRSKLPEDLEVLSAAKVVIRSAGMLNVPCYEYVCRDAKGRGVRIYVDADKGTQCRIEV